MNQTAIFWPMLAQVLLVLIVYIVLLVRRVGAVKSGEARVRQFKGRNEEPASSATVANNVMNQFELPVLFYACCICLYVTQAASFLTVLLAWAFVLLRYAHAYVHLTSNSIRWRMMTFALGVVMLVVMWLCFALNLAGL